MKRYWLRGMALGLSMALLLTGGIALAGSLMVEPGCFQCFEGTANEFENLQPGYPYSYTWESCGWEPGEELRYTEWWLAPDIGAWKSYYGAGKDGCISGEDRWGWTCDGVAAHHGSEVAADFNEHIFPEDYWGLLEICVEPTLVPKVSASQIVCETILFAEECPAEFVPEPGTIALLGTGLAGLAGYATLRWRTRG
jgi:hypothetical protein